VVINIKTMKLNLGAGNDIQKGYINHDISFHREDIDVIFNLNDKIWSEDEEYVDKDERILQEHFFEEIRAWDVIEHLEDPINFMDNCWRLLKSDGILKIKACGWNNPNFYVDITHKRPYDIKSFDYFCVDTLIEKEYSYYTDKKWRYLDGFPKYDRKMNIIVEMTPIK